MTIVNAQVLSETGAPYPLPDPDQKEVTLATNYGTIVVSTRVIIRDWGPHQVRIEGYTTYDGHERCLVIASYEVERLPVGNVVGMIDIYLP